MIIILEKCSKCGENLKDNSIVVWKCNNCDKSFKGNLQFLQNLQKKKDGNPEKNLLKCNNCASWLDDGKEDISVKCTSCGNVVKGDLGYFIGKTGFIKCPGCRRSILYNVKYCPECGYNIGNVSNNNKEKRIMKKKHNSYVRNICIIVFVLLFLVTGIYFYKINHREVIHGIYWGMDVDQVKKKEKAYSNTYGNYNEKDNYYALSNVDFYGESVTLMYIFEKDKLTSIWVKPTYDLYETAYRIAFNICKENNMPVSFADYTDEDYAPRSVLQWNIKGTTIRLTGDYQNEYLPSYYFSLESYDGNDYGDDYKDKGICCVGERTFLPCRNNIVPWGEIKQSDGYCYKHGCYVIGCPNSFANVYDQESLCLKHHFLCE